MTEMKYVFESKHTVSFKNFDFDVIHVYKKSQFINTLSNAGLKSRAGQALLS